MLKSYGNDGYGVIKMLEPVCTLRVSQLARAHRPEMPEFPHYAEFINEQMVELERRFPGSRRFLELVNYLHSPEDILTYAGSFRHWGHPNIDYHEGLRALHQNVIYPKFIDKIYANVLASDLAFIVLQKQFRERKTWSIPKDLMAKEYHLKEHFENDTWPVQEEILALGNNWHKLALKCFEFPDVIDPFQLYSDKSHSMERSKVLEHIKPNPNQPIPTKKVLQTFIDSPATIRPEFLSKIDAEGLSWNDLVIG